MKTRNLFKTLLLGVCFVGVGLAWGQEYPQHVRDFLLKAQGIEQTIGLKDGRVLTYRELVLMPEELRKETRGLVVSRGAYASFQDWVIAAINADTEETKRRTAAINADTEETKRRTAAIIASDVPGFEKLAKNLRLVLGAGLRPNFPISKVNDSFQVLKLHRHEYMNAGLNEETYKFFESLAKLPDWPKKLDERP